MQEGKAAMQPIGDVWAWLRASPSEEELRAAYPRDWRAVEQTLAAEVERGDVRALEDLAIAMARPRAGSGRAALTAEIRRQMTVHGLRRLNVALATGVATGTVRFNRRNGWVIQRLFFEKGLTRKPVSMFWYRRLWKRLPQRRYLMPLVQPEGIYCFYSDRLIEELASLIGDRPTVEIAAGDGTLTRFLRAAGVDIVATDDHSWSHTVEGRDVIRQDAVAALRTRQPKAVVCSWPPTANSFEQQVFRTRSVEIYIVIGSRHEKAAGSWATYRRQSTFELVDAHDLDHLVLPEELEPAVHVFRRKAAAQEVGERTRVDAAVGV